jgi:FkbH-like protein
VQWLMTNDSFRADLRAALAAESAPEQAERLAALTQYRLDPLQIIQLDRALAKLAPMGKAVFPSLRLAILASSTMDHCLPAIRVAGLRRRLLLETYLGTYGQYRQELLDPGSALHEFRPQVILLSLTAREATASIPPTSTQEQAAALLEATIADLSMLWRAARENLHAVVLQQTFLNTGQSLFGSYDRLVAGAPVRLIRRLNDTLESAAAAEGVALVDVAGAADRDGLNAWFDVGRWLQGKMEVCPQATPMYGELVARVIGAQRGLSKKCMVLDLDNTLWGGVIGDDGLDGIVLGEGSGTGEAHLALQRYAKQLKDRGIILAVCSKNDAQVAEEAFHKHPEMLLRRGDIACFVANWKPKAENLRHIAATLNIGLDSLVFVDDNPVERAGIRAELPMVAVPELPDDVAQYVRCIADAGYFEAVAFTSEDQDRAEQYMANAARAADLQSAGSLEGFLSGLGMYVEFGRVRPVDLARVTQLINKTNQFNPTTRRHSLEEVTRFGADAACVALQFRLVDRRGDNGLVSVLILRPVGTEAGILSIDTWVMSCRVFGRELEFEIMNIAVEAAREHGACTLHADYIPTAKNDVIRNLYPTLGFQPRALTVDEPGKTGWQLSLDQYQPRRTHISRRPNPND